VDIQEDSTLAERRPRGLIEHRVHAPVCFGDSRDVCGSHCGDVGRGGALDAGTCRFDRLSELGCLIRGQRARDLSDVGGERGIDRPNTLLATRCDHEGDAATVFRLSDSLDQPERLEMVGCLCHDVRAQAERAGKIADARSVRLFERLEEDPVLGDVETAALGYGTGERLVEERQSSQS
jgi:hypothetical protein